jgi:hypothetical protein
LGRDGLPGAGLRSWSHADTGAAIAALAVVAVAFLLPPPGGLEARYVAWLQGSSRWRGRARARKVGLAGGLRFLVHASRIGRAGVVFGLDPHFLFAGQALGGLDPGGFGLPGLLGFASLTLRGGFREGFFDYAGSLSLCLGFLSLLCQLGRVASRALADGRPASEPKKGFGGARARFEASDERDGIPDDPAELMEDPVAVRLAAHLINLLAVDLGRQLRPFAGDGVAGCTEKSCRVYFLGRLRIWFSPSRS